MMKIYSEHKKTDFRILKKIPSHWSLQKIKFIANIYTGDSLNDDYKTLFESDDKDHLAYISSKDINVDTSEIQYENGMRIPSDYGKFKIAPKNSAVLCIEGGSAGRKLAFTNQDVYFVNKLACFNAVNPITAKFIYYSLKSDIFQTQFYNSITGMIGGVSISNLKNFYLSIPPLSEQTQITRFLDHQTAIIDEIIQRKEKQIELLKEKRQSIINEVVTNGINPNAKMKDSGIEWLGDFPENWEIKKIKHLSQVISKGTTPSTEGRGMVDSGIRYLKAENIKDNLVSEMPEFYIDDETNEILKRSQLKENDILFVIAGATIGKTAILQREFTPANTNQAISFIRLKENENYNFVHYWLMSPKIIQQVWFKAVTSAQPNLSMENLGNLPIFYPPKQEQIQIVDFLKIVSKRMDEVSLQISIQIESLKEYRQSLISEAVTGKIDVRDWQTIN